VYSGNNDLYRFAVRRDQKRVETTEEYKNSYEDSPDDKIDSSLKILEAEYLKDQQKDDDRIKKAYRLVKEFWMTLEAPVQNECNFMMFLQKQRYCVKFSLAENKLTKRTISLSHSQSHIVDNDGFKVIQTPHSNRVFLIGGDDHPYGTFEFDLEKSRFFDDEESQERCFLPLDIGRSHHSLAATSGMIFCTGGHPDYLRRNGDPVSSKPDLLLGRVIEVYKLKDKMWLSYSNKLMSSRF
jgi:hypothetical protein